MWVPIILFYNIAKAYKTEISYMLALSSRWVHSYVMAPSSRNLVSLVVRFYNKWEFGRMYLSNGWLVNSKQYSGKHAVRGKASLETKEEVE